MVVHKVNDCECGNPASHMLYAEIDEEHADGTKFKHGVECLACGSSIVKETMEDATLAWNRRMPGKCYRLCLVDDEWHDGGMLGEIINLEAGMLIDYEIDNGAGIERRFGVVGDVNVHGSVCDCGYIIRVLRWKRFLERVSSDG